MRAVVKVKGHPAIVPPATVQRTSKILVCHPIWAGDRDYSTRLLRLLSDLEPKESTLADFVVVSRFDCEPDKQTIHYLSRKFQVYTHTSPHRVTGWPRGCNGVFAGAISWAHRSMIAGTIPYYQALLILAADVAPLQADWLPQLVGAWESVRAQAKTCVAGALIPAGAHGHAHINGDCMFLSTEPEFFGWLALRSNEVVQRAGWDWTLAHQFRKRGWADLPMVRSVWRKDNFTEADWAAETERGTLMYHGVKNFDLVDLARKKLLA